MKADEFLRRPPPVAPADPRQQVTAADLERLRHMLGVWAWVRPSQWGFRNGYIATESEVPSMRRLCAAGYAEPQKHNLGIFRCYRATLAGAKHIGLPEEAIRRLVLGVPTEGSR